MNINWSQIQKDRDRKLTRLTVASWEHYAAGLREQARLAPDPATLLASAVAADDVANKIRTETETDGR